MENHGPPPTDPLVRKEPPFEWATTSDRMPRRVETAIPPEKDPDIAMWQTVDVSIWPFAGAPTVGVWPRGWLGIDNTGTLYVCKVGGSPGTWASVGGGDGGGGNSPIVRAFPFAFNTPDILTGASIYTPTVGDVLLDAWIEIDTAWDGTTPVGDFGTFNPAHTGMFADASSAVPMSNADIVGNSGLFEGSELSDLHTSDAVLETTFAAQATGASTPFALSLISTPVTQGTRVVPAKFTSADPIKVVVSQNGANNGADPGSTQGAAILYLVTVTPT